MVGEGLGDEPREWDGPGAAVGLGRAEGQLALDLDGDLGDSQLLAVEIEASAAEPGQLSEAEAAVGIEKIIAR